MPPLLKYLIATAYPYSIAGMTIVQKSDARRRFSASGLSIRAKMMEDIYKAIKMITPIIAKIRFDFMIKVLSG